MAPKKGQTPQKPPTKEQPKKGQEQQPKKKPAAAHETRKRNAPADAAQADKPTQKVFTELKRWKTQHFEKGETKVTPWWEGKLSGLHWDLEKGEVTEQWKWKPCSEGQRRCQ